MEIGIIGLGFVGSALEKSFRQNNISLQVYDKYKSIGSIDLIYKTDIVFLCLPTLYKDNSYDLSSIHEICSLLNNSYKGLVVIKSTVEPLTTVNLNKQYNLNIIHNPEFLTARTAYEDFHNQTHIVLGSNGNNIDAIISFYEKYYPNAKISLCSATESESMKLFCNSFYAAKVQIFNEFYLLCQKLNINYDHVKDMMLINDWINPMHTNVPGPDGKLSFGGDCFPKDISALISFMNKLNSENKVLKAVKEERDEMRNN